MTKITVETSWLAEFAGAVAAGDPARALAAIEPRATAHAGTANAADKRAAAKAIVSGFRQRPADLARWARWLAGQSSPTAKDMGAVLLSHSYPEHKREAIALLQRLCDDANWEVREWGGSAAGVLLDKHFDEMYPVLMEWTGNQSELVRRAVAIAVMGATNSRKPERCDALFELMEPLVRDRAEYVRQNTGPFAIGKLLSHYPEATLSRVRRWAQADDEIIRWNAAMVFASASARNHVDAALDILSDLARDQRRLVWMAVSSALRNLGKRDPERVVPILRAWLADDRKLPAELTIRRLKVNS